MTEQNAMQNSEMVGELDIYDNGVRIGQVDVKDSQWQQILSKLSHGVHVFHAEARGVKSSAWRIRVPLDEYTSFDDGTLGGWVDKTPVRPGKPGDPDKTDLTFAKVGTEPGMSVFNYTYTQQSAGAVLEKKFVGLEICKNYEFSIQVRRANNAYTEPLIYLTANGEAMSSDIIPLHEKWTKISGVVRATDPDITFAVNNRNTVSSGNDYYMDDFHVREL